MIGDEGSQIHWASAWEGAAGGRSESQETWLFSSCSVPNVGPGFPTEILRGAENRDQTGCADGPFKLADAPFPADRTCSAAQAPEPQTVSGKAGQQGEHMHKRAMTMVVVGALAGAISTGCSSDGGGRTAGAEGGGAGAPEGGSGNETAAGDSTAGSAGADIGAGGTTIDGGGTAGSAGEGALAGAGGLHEDPESVVLGGTWMDGWGMTHTIDDEIWVQSLSGASDLVFHITQFDNAEEFLIARNDSDNEYGADLWSRFDWTTWNGSVWYCQTAYDAASEADALSTPRADDSDPASSGCGEFAWTELLDPSAVGTGGAGGAGGGGGSSGGGGAAGMETAGSSGEGGAAGAAGEAAGGAEAADGGSAGEGGAESAGGGGAAGAAATPTAGSAGAFGAGGASSTAGAGGASSSAGASGSAGAA